MKRFKGTKGEWMVHPLFSNNIYVEVCDNITSSIAVANGFKETEHGYYKYSEEVAKANAQLISAAPDLLEALLNIENDNGSISKTIWDMRNEAIKKALGDGTI